MNEAELFQPKPERAALKELYINVADCLEEVRDNFALNKDYDNRDKVSYLMRDFRQIGQPINNKNTPIPNRDAVFEKYAYKLAGLKDILGNGRDEVIETINRFSIEWTHKGHLDQQQHS